MSKKIQAHAITLPSDVADGITVATLKQFHQSLQQECAECMRKMRKPEPKDNQDLHRKNLADAQSMMIHFEEVLAYFGEKPDPIKKRKAQ